MSLICCPECNRNVSDKAKICPNCGYPVLENELVTDNEEGYELEEKESTLSILSLILYFLSGFFMLINYFIGIVFFVGSVVCAHISYSSGKRTRCADIAWWLHIASVIIFVVLFAIIGIS